MKARCNGSGRRVTLSVGEAVKRQVRCPCGKVVKIRVAVINDRYEATLPYHNKPEVEG